MQEDERAKGAGRSSILVVDVPLVVGDDACVQEDEMPSWLQYPTDDLLDRADCSGDLYNPYIQLVKDSFLSQALKGGLQVPSGRCAESNCDGLPSPLLMSTEAPKSMNADTAMALGAGRAVGLLSQAGAETFLSVRTTVQPSATVKPPSAHATHMYTAGSTTELKRATHHSHPVNSSPGDLDRAFSLILPDASVTATNARSPDFHPVQDLSQDFHFPPFSSAVTASATDHPALGTSSSPIKRVLAKPTPVICVGVPYSQESMGFCSQGGTAARQSPVSPSQGWCLRPALPAGHDVGLESRRAEVSSHLNRQEISSVKERLKLSNHPVMSLSGSAITVSEREAGALETADAVTSPSRGSGNSIEKTSGDEFVVSKKKMHPTEDSDNQSEEFEEVTGNAKKPPAGRATASKRSRAAETHNESEKRRRNKINVRMKALQDLIPNANKTDKASMLDEVIEYMKMLQAQLQMICMRTGMAIPPMMMPPGMQYFPVQQMSALPQMGVGMNMGMGMGVGMGMGMGMEMGLGVGIVDASAGFGVNSTSNTGQAASSIPVQPLPSAPGPGVCFPPSNLVHFQDCRGHSQPSCTSETYNTFTAQTQVQVKRR